MRLMLAGFRTSNRRALCAAITTAGLVALACDLDEVENLLRLDARYGVVLDLTLGDGEGAAIAASIRADHPHLPLVGLTGLEPVERRVAWLAAFDRCLPITEDPQVVLAEVAALGRRCEPGLARIVQVGPVVLDLDRGTVDVGPRRATVTAAEADMLRLLMVSAGRFVTKQAIYAELFGGRDVTIKLIEVYVCKLRGKLAAIGAPPDFIRTIWGRGYTVDERPAEPARELAA